VATSNLSDPRLRSLLLEQARQQANLSQQSAMNQMAQLGQGIQGQSGGSMFGGIGAGAAGAVQGLINQRQQQSQHRTEFDRAFLGLTTSGTSSWSEPEDIKPKKITLDNSSARDYLQNETNVWLKDVK